MTINKFSNNLDGTPLHSSHYAHEANADGFGAISPQTFNQRMDIENNRQSVRRYGDSLIAYGQHRHDALERPCPSSISGRPTAPGNSLMRRRSDSRQRPGFSSGAGGMKPAQRSGFTEPPQRGYNPYQ